MGDSWVHLRLCEIRGYAGCYDSSKNRHVFTMTGADPNTEWLGGRVALDDKGLIRTGSEVRDGWSLERDRYPLETGLPGVFAVVDIRAESAKRVASAVGERSMVIQYVHKFLAE
jgi:thioredoxin reductase (NADPH)